MGTSCTTFLADIFLDTLEAEYILKKRNKDKNKYRS
jgi:hypothetical protein